MADDKISFLLDLDVKEFTEQGLQAQGIISKLGAEENLTGLLEGLTKAGTFLGIAGAAAFTFKKALDLTVEGEEINRINKQFEILAAQAGIGPKELKEGLEKAAGGLADTTDILKIANEALVKMGGSGAELPKIMEIARKSVSVYGGDAKTNFAAISEAIANGNVKALKHYGITIDLTKAEKEFAAANGVTAGELSEVGKKQAILNAALEAGEQRYKNINEDTKSATTILQTLKTTFKDIGESFTVAFEKTIGPGVRSFLGNVQSMASSLKLHLKASIGDGAEAAAAKLELTQNRIKGIQADIEKLEKVKGTALDLAPADTLSRIQALQNVLIKVKGTLGDLDTQHKNAEKQDDAATAKRIANIQQVGNASSIDLDKQKLQRAMYSKEVMKLDQDIFKLEQTNITSITQIEQLNKTRLLQIENQYQTAVRAIRANTQLTTSQQNALIAKESKKFDQERIAAENQTAAFRKKLLTQYAANSKNTFAGIGASFKANVEKMKIDMADFGKRGDEIFASLQQHSTSAFEQMGADMVKGKDIGQATADALKSIFLNVIADRAIAEGSVLLLTSIWPPNPVGLAAGAGLIALGGALKAVSSSAGGGGGSSGSVSVPSTGGGGGGGPQSPISSAAVSTQSDQAAAISASGGAAMPAMEQQQKAQRTVSVHIAGNYLETDQTKRMLMDLMRQESDATGFNYNQIGA